MPSFPSLPLPWRDRAGRFSGVRAATLVVLFAPLAWLVWRWLGDDLGPRPITEALRFCGDRSIETLIAAIAITPLRRLSGWSALIGARRMIGLAAFFWGLAHLGLYGLDQKGDLGKIATEIAVRPYLTLGFVALLGLTALAATSTDGAIRRLGGARWGRLHGLVHPIAVLALVHVLLQVRLDPTWAVAIVGAALGGLAVRVAAERGPVGAAAVAVATAVAWSGAAATELAWFAARTTRPLAPVALANVDWGFRVAPSWSAAGVVLIVGAAAVAWRRLGGRRRAGLTAS